MLTAPAPGPTSDWWSATRTRPDTTSTPFTYQGRRRCRPGRELGDFTVAPTNPTATGGQPITLTARWSGVDAAAPYLGWIEYPDGSGTIVTVN